MKIHDVTVTHYAGSASKFVEAKITAYFQTTKLDVSNIIEKQNYKITWKH